MVITEVETLIYYIYEDIGSDGVEFTDYRFV